MERDELEKLYEKHYRSLYLYALSLTKSPEDAKDLVSDTFIRAWLSYRSDRGEILRWMMLVLKRLFIDRYRQQKRMADGGDLLEWVQDPYDALEHYISAERKRWLYGKIYELPKVQREIMLLTAATDLKDEAIAEIVNQSVSNVRVLRHRARKVLAEMAAKEGYL